MKRKLMLGIVTLAAGVAVCMASAQGVTVRTETVTEFTGEAIQRAINALAEKGGGKVVVPAGRYPITLIRLRSGI